MVVQRMEISWEKTMENGRFHGDFMEISWENGRFPGIHHRKMWISWDKHRKKMMGPINLGFTTDIPEIAMVIGAPNISIDTPVWDEKQGIQSTNLQVNQP